MAKVDERTIDLSDLFRKQQTLTDYVWKKHNIKKADMDKEKALEEIVDMLHFYLQIGNILGVVYEHRRIEIRDTILDQIMAINLSLMAMDGPLMWALSFAQYRGLVQMLGFDWDQDIIQAYNRKFQENIARQQRGY